MYSAMEDVLVVTTELLHDAWYIIKLTTILLLELSACTSDFWFESFNSFVHTVHILCLTLDIHVPCAAIKGSLPKHHCTVQKLYMYLPALSVTLAL